MIKSKSKMAYSQSDSEWLSLWTESRHEMVSGGQCGSRPLTHPPQQQLSEANLPGWFQFGLARAEEIIMFWLTELMILF